MNTTINIARAVSTNTVSPGAVTVRQNAQQPQADKEKPVEATATPKLNTEQMMRELQEAVQRINEELKRNGRELNFSMDSVLDYPVVTVKNSTTGEVIRQIPNETTIRIAHSLSSLKGLLHNKSA